MYKSTVMSKATLIEEPAWWLKPLAEPKAELVTEAAGLSNAEAGSRLAKFGPSLFRDHQVGPCWCNSSPVLRIPLVILLLVASAISAFTGEITNFVIISVMVMFVLMVNGTRYSTSPGWNYSCLPWRLQWD